MSSFSLKIGIKLKDSKSIIFYYLPHVHVTRMSHDHMYFIYVFVSFSFLRFGSFNGNDEKSLDQRFSTCKRTSDYAKSLPAHQFELDLLQNQQQMEERKSQVRERERGGGRKREGGGGRGREKCDNLIW